MQQLEDIRLGIFDHSGVLSDDRQPVYVSNNMLLEIYGLPPISFEEWRAPDRTSAGGLVAHFAPDVDEKEVDDAFEHIYNILTTRTRNPIKATMYAGVPKVLETLRDDKGMRLAVVSKVPTQNLELELKEYEIFDYFDVVSGGTTPKEQRILHICSELGVEPQQAFFVEDLVPGVISGHSVGVNTFGVTTGYHTREKLKEAEDYAVAIIDSLGEILDYV